MHSQITSRNGKISNSLLLIDSMVLLLELKCTISSSSLKLIVLFLIQTYNSVVWFLSQFSRYLFSDPDWFWSQMWLMMMWDVTLLTPCWWSWLRAKPEGSLLPWCSDRNDCFCFNNKLKASSFSSVSDHQRASIVITFWSSSSSLLTCYSISPKASPISSLASLLFLTSNCTVRCVLGRV